jgi:hypothetical protein
MVPLPSMPKQQQADQQGIQKENQALLTLFFGINKSRVN